MHITNSFYSHENNVIETKNIESKAITLLGSAWRKVESFHNKMTGDLGYKLHRPMLRLVSNLNSISAKILHVVKDHVDLSAKGIQSATEAINITKEVQKIKVLTLFPTLFVGFSIHEAVKKFQTATKVREYAEASGHCLGVVKDLINVPKDVVGICALFDEGISQAAQIASWGPGISVTSLVLSVAAIGLKANDLRKGEQFSQRMERKSSSQVIKHIASCFQTQEFFKDPAVQEDLSKACKAVCNADTMLLFKEFREEIKKESFSSEHFKQLLENAKNCATFNADAISALEQILPSGQEEGGIKKSFAAEVDKQINRLRKLRDDIPLTKITEKLKEKLCSIDTSILPTLDNASALGYHNAIKSTRDSVLKRHYGVSGAEMKKCIERTEKVYRALEKDRPAEAQELRQRSVRLLKDQHEKKMISDKLALSSSVISFVASLILVILGFGIACTPLSIISLLLSTVVIGLTFAKIAYDHIINQKFSDSFGITEIKHCQGWQESLQQVEKDLESAGFDNYQSHIQELRAAIDYGSFDQCEHITLSSEEEKETKLKDAIKEFNMIVKDMSEWQKKKNSQLDKYLFLPEIAARHQI